MRLPPVRSLAFAVAAAVRQGAGVALSYAFGREECLRCGAECCGRPLCPECARAFLQEFEPPGGARCGRCGRPLLGEEDVCMACREAPVLVHAERVLPLYSYRLWRKALLFEWKLGGARSLSPLFAAAFARGLEMLYPGVPHRDVLLVPVPPRPGKVRREGWDQMAELCAYLRHQYGFTVLPLLRRLASAQQKKKGREQRLAARYGGYALSPRCGRVLSRWRRRAGVAPGAFPQEVVVLDDVITTGATVEGCAALLRGLGVGKVTVLSLLIVD